MVSSTPDYAVWFEENVLKYKSIATNTGAMMLHLVFEAGLDLTNITYKGLFKDIVKGCAYKFVSESIGITVPQIKLLVAIYNGTYKLMNSLTKNSEAGEQYFIMNYISPIERSLENVIENVGTNLISDPTSGRSDQCETAYNILRYTNKYLYSAAYNFGVYAKNKSDMEAATILKHIWTLANCHNKIIINRSKYINVACPTDVYLYNATGELVVAIVDDLVVTYTDPYVTIMNYDGEKSLMYPADKNYTIRIVAREDGTMDYSIIEVEDDEALRYIEFYDLELSSGQEFSGCIPEGFGINEVEYTLVTNTETIAANYDSDRSSSCADNQHSWGEWITKIEPTTENFGLKERLCAVCGKIESSSIQPKEVATYTVVFNANGGTGTMADGLVSEGIAVTLPSCGFTSPADKIFDTWAIGSTDSSITLEAGSKYTFTTDTTVYAIWKNAPIATYSLTVTNGTGSGDYEAGTQVSIVANAAPEGKEFDQWTTNNGGTFVDASSASTIFTMTADDVTVIATYKDIVTPPVQTYSLTVTNGTGSGSYEAGTQVSIVADAAPEGKQFDKWTTNSGGSFADVSSVSTIFTMPAGDVTVTATYEEIVTPPVQTYSLTVTNGTGRGSYEVGTQVSIVADAAPEDKQFDKWMTSNGGTFADASSASTIFTMPAGDVAVVATYKDITTPPAPEHIHNWTANWISNETHHWHECMSEDCPINSNKDGYSAHTSDGGKVTVAATAYQDGVQTYSCTICKYVIKTETLPATGGNDPYYPSGDGSTGSRGRNPINNSSYSVNTPFLTLNGTIRVNPSRARRGDIVTITVAPDVGYKLEELIAADSKGNELALADKGEGQYTFAMPADTVKVDASFAPIETPWSNPFADVAEGTWCYDTVQYVSKNALMGGYGNGLFGVNDNLTRAQFAQILYNKESHPMVNYLVAFSDVAGEAWYTEAVCWAASQGIVGGYGDGLFGPNDSITREQLAVMLWRHSGSPAATNKELHFSDANEASSYALNALRWAAEQGIINGKSSGILDPKGFATRAQVAQMLKNYLER